MRVEKGEEAETRRWGAVVKAGVRVQRARPLLLVLGLLPLQMLRPWAGSAHRMRAALASQLQAGSAQRRVQRARLLLLVLGLLLLQMLRPWAGSAHRMRAALASQLNGGCDSG